MLQNAIVALVVAAAAAWVVWSMLLPRRFRRQIKARMTEQEAKPDKDCGGDCGGGCAD